MREKIIKGIKCKVHGETTKIFYLKKDLEYVAFCPLCVEQILLQNLNQALYFIDVEVKDE